MNILEIACFNIESAIAAEKAGADRIELCDNPADGGTTPSYGTLQRIQQRVTIPVFPIIRPRGGDFLYTEEEFEAMKKDLQLVKDLGFKGAVIGLLCTDGSIDKKRTRQLVELAGNMQLTFHRAFDRCRNPLQSLEDIIATGCARILTSGQKPNVNDAGGMIAALVEKAAGRITILPGSGVRSKNLAALVRISGANEFHSSARTEKKSGMQFTVAAMEEELTETFVDENEIKKMKQVLNHM